uniref:RRM domain-containing protein n=1 Tax=Astatotilapia calliptera TaxID=8154 RepID=A0AAX7TIN5_ASTCA
MSRLIVKNLPNGMKEDRFRSMFAAFGTLTDCSLKFTKDGKFRKFGFVGFKSEEDANKALKHFNKSFVDTSRVTVEMCKAFGDPSKARAWSKHTQSSGQGKPSAPADTDGKKVGNTCGREITLEEEAEFKEFLSVHQNRSQAPTWANDTAQEAPDPDKKKKTTQSKKKPASDDYLNFDSDQSEEDKEDEEEENDESEEEDATKEALKSGLSDMDYLRSKVAQTADTEEEEEEEDDDGPLQHTDSDYESGDRENISKVKSSVTSEEKDQSKVKKPAKQEATTEFTVKLRGVPFNVKEKQIREFMTPLKPAAVRIGKNESGNRTGYVYVDLHSEEEVEKALKKNKDYIGGRYIEVFRVDALAGKNIRDGKEKETDRNFSRKLKEDEEEEDVSESGRLFIRNLPYTCTEEDIKDLFSKHGPLSDVLFPIDTLTKRPKGFAFVTYMIPENAVTALAQLDGHIFQGRMLHLLPSTVKKEKSDSDAGGPGSSSYKRQKDAKTKALSSSSHNWNTLFLGTSAVADAIAEKYNTTKSQVLDHESKGSVAVRMALGETQIVQETRQFLLDNSVSLDSFSQAAAARSNTVILVKNLPAGVQASELEELFSPYGSLGRVLLPPSGLTAIVEFLESTEAKRAFTRMAYSKFHHVPLYLEWAPVGVFVAKPEPGKLSQNTKEEKKIENEEEDDEEEEEALPGSTLFIKNLNFNTTEEKLLEKGFLFPHLCLFTYKNMLLNISADMFMVRICGSMKTSLVLSPLIHFFPMCRTAVVTRKKKQADKKQTGSKILVRNVPFQASVREIRELFCTFGELKTVRLPKKAAGSGSHRGFGFVDFLTKQDAKVCE